MEDRQNFVVIGGGIAGVTCAETLGHLTDDKENVHITLISASPLIKAVVNHKQIGYTMEYMDIAEKASDTLTARFTNLTVKHSLVEEINVNEKTVLLSDGSNISYAKVCITTGASPKSLSENPHVLSIRDTETVKAFQHKLKNARRVVVVGNGGIATELVYEVERCELIWCVKHKSICSAFIDGSAAQFFLPHLQESRTMKHCPHMRKRWKYSTEHDEVDGAGVTFRGNALGPDWAYMYHLSGAKELRLNTDKVRVEYEVEVERILTYEQFTDSCLLEHTQSRLRWPVYVKLTNGQVYGTDVVVNATGVVPTCDIRFSGGQQMSMVDEGGGILIDTEMRTNLEDVYAAGDVVSTDLWQHSSQWHQMRLWTQAKQMGCYSAKCMINHSTCSPVEMDFCFELFSHVTQFFGFKVVLLGLYNGQGLDPSEYTVHLRCTKGEEYVKLVVQDGRLVGAVLIGDTDLEETFENLILNKLDISFMEDRLLDSSIDIEDFFD